MCPHLSGDTGAGRGEVVGGLDRQVVAGWLVDAAEQAVREEGTVEGEEFGISDDIAYEEFRLKGQRPVQRVSRGVPNQTKKHTKKEQKSQHTHAVACVVNSPCSA